VVSFTLRRLYIWGKSPWYPLDRGLGGLQSRSGSGSEENTKRSPGSPWCVCVCVCVCVCARACVLYTRGSFAKSVDSRYSEWELCGGAVTVSFSKYLPWQAMHFFKRSTHFGSASLAKGGASEKRPSPHLHKVPTQSNKVSPRTFQTALVCVCVCVFETFRGLRCLWSRTDRKLGSRFRILIGAWMYDRICFLCFIILGRYSLRNVLISCSNCI
jgi:hypothetical protein